MFAIQMNRAAAYARVERETGVTAASPHRLITMLYDGALLSLSSARMAMENRDIAAKGQAISKTIDIISNGLRVSVDEKAGGEIAGNLISLYDYMIRRLLHANLRNDMAALDEVIGHLEGLRESWKAIEPRAATQAAAG